MITNSNDSTAKVGGTALYLDVTLNGASDGLAHFGYLNGELWASLATLGQLGFALPTGTPDPVRLNALQGVRASYDASRQAVTISAQLSLLKLSTAVLNTPENKRPKASASPGILFNYDIYGTEGGQGSSTLSAYTELRAFNDDGVFSSTALWQANDTNGNGWQDHSVRLDTNWTESFPDSLLTLKFGDTLTGALSWTRSTRIAGVQLGTNFALQPYLVTTPLPSFFGSAILPSAIQLYINGVRQYSGNVPAGPFQLNTIPTISGAGNAQVVMVNALGQATTVNFSLYDEHQLLQQGLSDWSGEFGVVRENYGIDSFDYGHDPIGSGTWRYGVTNNFTAEAHGEATYGLTNGGVGGDWLLGSAGGVLSATLAGSENAGQRGVQYGLGYSWNNNRFNFSISGTRASNNYRDVATLYGSPPPALTAQALVGYNTDHLGSFGMSYLDLRYPQQSATRYASAYWFKSAGQHLSFNLSFNDDLNNSSNRSIFLVATLTLDHNISVSGGIQREGNHTGFVADASQSLPSQGGFGWRTSLSEGNNQNGGTGELDYLGRYGQVEAGLSSVDGTRYGYADATGSLVLMGGEVFAARQITDGFAVVSTDGIANVPVKLENNPIGTTDSHGLLLITPLNAYQNNQVSIDPMDLPADVRIARVQTLATPSDRSGILVRFGITPVNAASLILVNIDGKPLPVGSQVRAHDQQGEPALVGFDGAVYMDTLKLHNVLDVETPNGHCQVRFDYHKHDGSIPQIGPLRCITEATP
jgi:outer membrane usher protein